MTRLAVIFIVLCVALGAQYYTWTADQELEAKKKDLEEKLNAKGIVVYAIHEIQEGDVITANVLEKRAIPQAQIPQGAISLPSNAVGKKSRYGINRGQIVSDHDLKPYPAWLLRRMRERGQLKEGEE